MGRMSIGNQVKALRHMDNVIRSINDEETGIFESWITGYVPDEATDDELKQEIKDNPEFYQECCEFFAKYISALIDEGEWNVDGYTTEFFNSKAYEEPRS